MPGRILAMAFFLSCLYSRGNGSNPEAQSTANGRENKDSAVTMPQGTPQPVIPPPFDREAAETAVAMHYSALNREAKYLRYKGLLVNIDTILPARGDSVDFSATIHGRQWLTPTGDTTTKAFRERITFTAYPQGTQWKATRK